MTEVSAEIHAPKPPEAAKLKERLSDEQIGNLLSAIGNHEAKAITLLVMRNGDIFDRSNLGKQVLNAQGKSVGWIMDSAIPFGYCLRSLSPIGLVAKEALNSDLSTFGYSITEYGKEIGVPLAGLLLDFSQRHDISLGKLFGSTNSRSLIQTRRDIEFKKRPPITTLKVLYELTTSPSLPLREIDIEEVMGGKSPSVQGSVQDVLNRLKQIGLIQYEATERNRSFSGYKISDDIPKEELLAYRTQPTLTKIVLDILKENKDRYLTREDVWNFLPKEIRKRHKFINLRSDISGILAHLARDKYATIKKFNYSKQSEINLTDEQRILLTELLEIIYRFQSQDGEILEKGRRLANEIISNPKRVENLLRKAKEMSSIANKLPLEETKQDVLSIISTNPEGFTNKEIENVLKKSGRLLGRNRIAVITFALEKEGAVKSVKKGTEKRYFGKSRLVDGLS